MHRYTLLLHRLADLIEHEARAYPPALRRRALAEVAAARAVLARPRITLHGDHGMSNPFEHRDGTMTMSAADRIDRVRRFDENQCNAALYLHGLGSLTLQKTVVQALERRLRRLAKEAA